MINNSSYVKAFIESKLKKKGYTLTEFDDNGRTYLGKLKKSDRLYYLKIAKSKKETTLLQNSIVFNKKLENLHPSFAIPKVVESNYIFKDFLFRIETAIEGKPLATISKDISILNFKNPDKYFFQVYQLINWLQKQKINLPADIEKRSLHSSKNFKKRAVEAMIKWSFNNTPRLSDLLKIVQENDQVFKSTSAHRDVTPINVIIVNENKIGLIDADIAQSSPKYYDVAEFYNRLWTRVCRPDLARKFLKIVVENHKGDKNYFYNHFLTISAFRAVGNYFETMNIKNNQKKRITYLTSYTNHIADKKFLL